MDFYYDTHKVTSKKSKDPFFDIFFGGDIMNEACYDCNSRSTMAYGDIRIGDYWGEKYDTNTKGVSAVVVKTPLGKVFFESIQQKMKLEKAVFSDIVKAQSYCKTQSFDKRRRSFLLLSISEKSDLQRIYKSYVMFKK